MSKSLNEKYNSKRFNLNINKDLEKLNNHLELLNNLYNFNSTPDKTGYINKDYLIQEDILKVYRNKIEFLKNNIISKLDNLYNEIEMFDNISELESANYDLDMEKQSYE